jgi:hypothetical protein
MKVEVLKLAMLTERDKLRAERENSQVSEELTARTKEVERLAEQLQSCDKDWQARLAAETSEWQARLAEHQQDVDTERDKMAEAIAGKKNSDKFQFTGRFTECHCNKFH